MANFLIVFGVLALVVSAFMPVFDRVNHRAAECVREKATRMWAWIDGVSPGQVPPAGIGAFERGLELCVDTLICEADRSAVLSPLVVTLLSLILPLAALANAMLGGSPFLLLSYMAVAVMIVGLGAMDTMRRPNPVSNGLALVAVLSWTSILPLYAVRSLTLHYLYSPFAISVIALVLIAVLFYAALVGGWSLFRSGRRLDEMKPLERAAAFMLAGLPVFYIGYLIALAIDGAQLPQQSREWTSLAIVAASAAVFMAALGATLRIGLYRRGLIGTAATLAVQFALALLAGGAIRAWSGGPTSAAALPMAFWCMILFAIVATATMRALWSADPARRRIEHRPVAGIAVAFANVGGVAVMAGLIVG